MSLSFYRRAGLYSAFFAPSDEIRTSIDRLARRHLGRRPRRVIDPACGPGLWLEHFRSAGAEVAGCDLEEHAIAAAAARLPKRGARVLVGDMRRPPDELGSEFDCAINLDNSIGHLNDPLDVVAHFASMRQRLSRRGIYVIGLAIREAKDTIPTGIVFERGPVDIAGGGFAALQRANRIEALDRSRCDRTTIRAQITRPAMLVIAECWHPGWRATVDGLEVPLWQVNYIQQGLWLEPGSHTVELTFFPDSMRYGAVASALAAGAVLAAVAVTVVRRRSGARRRDADAA